MAILAKWDWMEKLSSLHNQSAFGALGGKLISVDDSNLELSLKMSHSTLTPFGFLHGGISVFLAETAASTHACWGIDMDEMLPVGIEINASHVKAAQSGTLVAQAKIINRTRKLTVHQVSIRLKESDDLLSSARVTNYYRKIF